MDSFFGQIIKPVIGVKTQGTSVISAVALDISQTHVHQTPIKIRDRIENSITNHEVIQPIEIGTQDQMRKINAIDYAWAQQLIPVVGRLHWEEHIAYWKQKIQAPYLVVSWLK